MTQALVDRILARCIPVECPGLDKPCQVWQGARTLKGYGSISEGGKLHRTHRVVCAHAHGQQPVTVFALHRCDNRACCEQSHLYWGKHTQNMEDRRTRNPRSAKLTADQVRAIRKSLMPWSYLASVYGVSRVTIGNAKAGRTFKHIV